MLQLVQVHELAGFGVEAHGCLSLRLPALLLLLLAGSPRHLLLQLVQLAALCFRGDKCASGSSGASWAALGPGTCAAAAAPPARRGQLLQDGAAALGLGYQTPGGA